MGLAVHAGAAPVSSAPLLIAFCGGGRQELIGRDIHWDGGMVLRAVAKSYIRIRA